MMKDIFILTSDWHYTRKKPANRIDNYQKTMDMKINTILEASDKLEATILLAGDLTDTPFLPYSEFIELLSIFDGHTSRIHTIYGQHDLKHRNKGNTPLDALEEAIPRLSMESDDPYCHNGIAIYGCSFGEEIPKIKSKDDFNILLIHRMILKQHEKQWEEKYELGRSILEKHDFNVIVSGDNHQTFTINMRDKQLINCGSIMRSDIDQIHHNPCYFILTVDAKNFSLEKVLLPFLPYEEVFNLEKKIKMEEKKEKLEEFISGFSGKELESLTFEDNLKELAKTNKVEPEVKALLDEFLMECKK